MPKHPRDRFDSAPRATGRVGAHRAENPHMNGWIVLLWAVVAAAILIVAGTFATLVYTGRITLGPEAVPTSTPAPVETGVVDTTFSVLILNGTSEAGLDARMRDTLVNAGWKGDDVIAGASGTTDFTVTTVYYESDADRPAALGLADLIGATDVVLSDHYANPAEPDARQLTIVIGQDATTGATEDAQGDGQ